MHSPKRRALDNKRTHYPVSAKNGEQPGNNRGTARAYTGDRTA